MFFSVQEMPATNINKKAILHKFAELLITFSTRLRRNESYLMKCEPFLVKLTRKPSLIAEDR